MTEMSAIVWSSSRTSWLAFLKEGHGDWIWSEDICCLIPLKQLLNVFVSFVGIQPESNHLEEPKGA